METFFLLLIVSLMALLLPVGVLLSKALSHAGLPLIITCCTVILVLYHGLQDPYWSGPCSD